MECLYLHLCLHNQQPVEVATQPVSHGLTYIQDMFDFDVLFKQKNFRQEKATSQTTE